MLEKRSSRSPGPALVTALLLQLPALLPLPAPSGVIATAAAATAGSVTGAQKDAALEYLAAVATGDPQQVAFAIHPDDLLALRTRILTVLHEEAKRGDSTVRSRLFGQGMPEDDLAGRWTVPEGKDSAAAHFPVAVKHID